MNRISSKILTRLLTALFALSVFFIIAVFLGLSLGSSGGSVMDIWQSLTSYHQQDATLRTIIWEIRFPRVLLAAMVGAALSIGGLVFQALLRNPLAEPYILGISGGSAIGAILGILMGLARFPGLCCTAFAGSMVTLLLIISISSGQSILKNNSLLLSGVMVNAFCSAVIMFMISITQDSRLHNIMFWLMGDLSVIDTKQAGILFILLAPCFIILFLMSNKMNLMLLGKETATTMGVDARTVTVILLILTSFMVSITVSYCGLLGFVGLVIPHLLRLIFGPDHRVLVPACILGGGTYMILCDVLARTLPEQGEMPPGVITALIGAPLFIYLLKRSAR